MFLLATFFQLWKLPSPVRDGCIYCEYKWIIDVDIALLDSTTVLGFRSRTEARSVEGMLIETGERVRTVRVVLGVTANAKHQVARRRG